MPHLIQIVDAVLTANELMYYRGAIPLTDAALAQIILRESKGHPSAGRFLLPEGHPKRTKVNQWRNKYNYYVHNKERPASCVSFRYNEDGKRISNASQTEQTPLTRLLEESIFWKLFRRNFAGKTALDALRLIHADSSPDDRVLARLQSLFAGDPQPQQGLSPWGAPGKGIRSGRGSR